MMRVALYQVKAPDFCAGMIVTDDRCTQAAPILARRMLGRTLLECCQLCVAHRWELCGPFFQGTKFSETNRSN
jgi:hypothetical protein